MTDTNEIKEALKWVDPVDLDYTQWLQIGMAIKDGGATCDLWDEWSKRDMARYHPGEVYTKWESFKDSGITVNTLFKMARESGYKGGYHEADEGHALDWDSYIEDINYYDDKPVIDKSWLERDDVRFPTEKSWNPIKEVETYLTTLFNSDDYVGYVVRSRQLESGKYIPYDSGNYSRTCGELLDTLHKTKSIEETFGTANPEGGAWIRFNPLDGKGVKDRNVVDYRYALIESDNMDVGIQSALLRKLELPIALMMYSGNKSIHAIVKINATNELQYKKRVDYLYISFLSQLGQALLSTK